MKLPEDNIGKTFSDINCTKVFLDQSPKAVEIKAKINKWDPIRPVSFFTAKETINKMKRQSTDWKSIFANDATNKDLISKIYKQFIQFNNNSEKTHKQPNWKLGRRPKQTFLQRRHTDGQEWHEETLSIASYGEMQMSAAIRHCLELLRGLLFKVKVKVESLSRVQFPATPWTAAYKVPPSMELSRQEYWSGLPFPSPGHLPDPGIKPGFPALQTGAFTVWATREAI